MVVFKGRLEQQFSLLSMKAMQYDEVVLAVSLYETLQSYGILLYEVSGSILGSILLNMADWQTLLISVVIYSCEYL